MTKQTAVSFKADQALVDLLRAIPNRSEFIRHAVLAAFTNTCPLCNGTGLMPPHQRQSWEAFTRSHPIHACDHCHEPVFSCAGRDLPHTCSN